MCNHPKFLYYCPGCKKYLLRRETKPYGHGTNYRVCNECNSRIEERYNKQNLGYDTIAVGRWKTFPLEVKV